MSVRQFRENDRAAKLARDTQQAGDVGGGAHVAIRALVKAFSLWLQAGAPTSGTAFQAFVQAVKDLEAQL